MSDNPIHDLADFLEEMNSSGDTTEQRLREMANEGENYWDVFDRGIELYAQARSLLRHAGMEEGSAEILRQARDTLIDPRSWNTLGPSAVTPLALFALRTAGDSKKVDALLPAPLTNKQLDGIRVALQKVLEVLTTHDDFPPGLREYIMYLINRAMDILDRKDVNLTALRNLSFQILGAGMPITAAMETEQRQTFLKHLGELVLPWLSAMTAGATGNLLAEGILNMITQK